LGGAEEGGNVACGTQAAASAPGGARTLAKEECALATQKVRSGHGRVGDRKAVEGKEKGVNIGPGGSSNP